jgi:uncharacterized membrane protein YedE/YeeE
MAFQMGVIILGSAWGGVELDKYLDTWEFPVFTLVFSILGVFLALYLSLKDLIKTNRKDK